MERSTSRVPLRVMVTRCWPCGTTILVTCLPFRSNDSVLFRSTVVVLSSTSTACSGLPTRCRLLLSSVCTWVLKLPQAVSSRASRPTIMVFMLISSNSADFLDHQGCQIQALQRAVDGLAQGDLVVALPGLAGHLQFGHRRARQF